MAKLIFGDNHLFGINHLSLDKAENYKAHYAKIENIKAVFEMLQVNGVGDQMISAHKTASSVCSAALEVHPSLVIHPVIPYAHAINDEAAAHGVIKTGIKLLMPSVIDCIKLGLQFISPFHEVKIPRSSVQRFVEQQLIAFGDIPEKNKGVLFINNVFCDLLIGMGAKEWFENFVSVCRSLGYEPGVITYNPRYFLGERIEGIKLCVNNNHKGFLNNLDKGELELLTKQYEVWAMGIFGSGAYSQVDVVSYLKKNDFSSVVFASSKEERLKSFIDEYYGQGGLK